MMRLKHIKTLLCCLFHVKGYSWYSPWVREEMRRAKEANKEVK